MSRVNGNALTHRHLDANSRVGVHYRTRNDLPEATRIGVIGELNQSLGDAIDLQCQCKHAQWNVKGASFIALHQLFGALHDDIARYVEMMAERVVQLGGIAHGTAVLVVACSSLPEYPLLLTSGAQHVDALSDALGACGRSARRRIDVLSELGDTVSAAIIADISHGIDRCLWLVEAHQQDGDAPW